MKTFSLFLLGICSVLLTPRINAQQFSIIGHVVAGGGGISQGSGFTITGTISQPEANSQLQNGCWSVTPGFWGVYATIPTPGAPQLRIHIDEFDPTQVRVAFTGDCHDWILQVTSELRSTAGEITWEDDEPGNLIGMDGELVRNFYIPSWGQRIFFRLKKR